MAKPNYVTVDANGKTYLNMREVNLLSLHELLVSLRTQDPNLSVVVRGDSQSHYQKVVDVPDVLQRANATKVALATKAAKTAN